VSLRVPDGPCECGCHVDGVEIFCSCFVPCCNRPGRKYVGEGGFDEERFRAHLRREEREREIAAGRRRGTCPCGRRFNKRGFCSACDEGKERD